MKILQIVLSDNTPEWKKFFTKNRQVRIVALGDDGVIYINVPGVIGGWEPIR